MKKIAYLLAVLFLSGCSRQSPPVFTTEVMNRFTPVKDQGKSELCWAYAMLAAIETEHIMQGDSVNLSPAFIERMADKEPGMPDNRRATAQTLLNMLQRHGIVAYDAYRENLPDVNPPRWVFLYGEQYTRLEFAHSVCTDGEYIALTTVADEPYDSLVVLDVPDNWEHNSFLNLPADTLLRLTERAVRQGHGVCWEGDISEPGFDWKRGVARTTPVMGTTTDDHCMSVVGLARDADGGRYFVMKNSWGTRNSYNGLLYMSFGYFHRKTIAVYMTHDAYDAATLQR